MPDLSSRCIVSGNEFIITEDEQDFCRSIGVPFPLLAPSERLRRRLSYINPYSVYLTKSSATKKTIFSMYTDDAPFPIIEKDTWWSDAWDAQDYAKKYDFERSFFDQFHELSKVVPHFPLSIIRIENSDWVNNASGLNRCYMTFGANDCEDCLYCERVNFCKDCIDCMRCASCELCYECVMCSNCYLVQNSLQCDGCSNSFFLINCQSCQSCFGCANLYRREYCIFNQQYSKSEYENFLNQVDSTSYAWRTEMAEKANDFWISQPVPATYMRQAEDCSGNYIFNSRRVNASYFIQDGENINHCFGIYKSKNCLGYSNWGYNAELIYESSTCGNNAYGLKFCYECFENVSNLEYCQYCISCQECFGCVGLRNRSYCIFNAQYSKDEYIELKKRIIAQMTSRNEYGEFFALKDSPVPYNHSSAFHFFPLTRGEAQKNSLRWYDKSSDRKEKAISYAELPDTVPSANDPLVVLSSVSSKPFKITTRELELSRRFKIPLPRMSYDERFAKRITMMGNPHLYERRCQKSGAALLTTYPPATPWKIWERSVWEGEYRG